MYRILYFQDQCQCVPALFKWYHLFKYFYKWIYALLMYKIISYIFLQCTKYCIVRTGAEVSRCPLNGIIYLLNINTCTGEHMFHIIPNQYSMYNVSYFQDWHQGILVPFEWYYLFIDFIPVHVNIYLTDVQSNTLNSPKWIFNVQHITLSRPVLRCPGALWMALPIYWTSILVQVNIQ